MLERLGRRRLPVRVRVTAVALVAIAGALGLSAAVVEVALNHDRQDALLASARVEAQEVVALNPEAQVPMHLPLGLVQVVRGGRVLAASRPLRRLSPLWSPGLPIVQNGRYLISPGRASDVDVVAVNVRLAGQPATVVVVTSLDQYDRTLQYVQRLLEVGLPVLLVVVGGICWLVVGRSLRPIEAIRREVADIAVGAGTRRIATPPVDDEVGRLAGTLNSMLDRLEASSTRQRRFVADASHELLSPIANIRTELEVALHRPERADWASVAAQVLVEDGRMARLVDELLLLARSDEGRLAVPDVAIDLAVVAASVVSASSGDGPALTLARAPAPVDVPAAYLERIVANLVDNARRFAVTAVRVTAGPEGRWAVLTVADDGPGVPQDERERVFERFVRLDPARDRRHGGFGLGLAIVADVCRAYGGSIEVGDAGPGAVFLLRLPLAGSDSVSQPAPRPQPPAPARPARVGR